MDEPTQPPTPATEEHPTLYPVVLRYIGERLRRGEITPVSARTIRQHLLQFADAFGNRPLAQLGPKAVERWMETTAHLAPATRASRLSSLRTFARWMVNADLITRDFTRNAPRIRRRRLVSRDLGVDEFRQILDACCGPRDTCIVWLMFGLGLRCVEVSRLHVDDFDVKEQTVVVCGKGRHERQLPVPRQVRAAVDAYLAHTGAVGGPLIRSELDPLDGISPERISGLAGAAIRRAGLKIRAFDGRSAHSLRAGAATDLYESCGDLRVVQKFLGHENIATTSVYLRKAGMAEIRSAQAGRNWGAPA